MNQSQRKPFQFGLGSLFVLMAGAAIIALRPDLWLLALIVALPFVVLQVIFWSALIWMAKRATPEDRGETKRQSST